MCSPLHRKAGSALVCVDCPSRLSVADSHRTAWGRTPPDLWPYVSIVHSLSARAVIAVVLTWCVAFLYRLSLQPTSSSYPLNR